mmetsp:Transcript_1872/g.4184  ORF Transcript_1872/g.4184 Transcript_1872/m.4184 type:complete len:170 (-) Transcript_1872:87-596(-)
MRVLAAAATSAASWEVYKQCDSRWGSQELGTCSSSTICSAGCAMTSVSMILKSKGVDVTPATLDHWLTTHGGYASGCLIVWASVDAYGATKFNGFGEISEANICAEIKKGSGLVANVRNGGHWVLLTGCKGGGVFTVNDPGFSQATYSVSDISNLAVYHMKASNSSVVV